MQMSEPGHEANAKFSAQGRHRSLEECAFTYTSALKSRPVAFE
jgi:hypothetical protein